MAHLDIEFPRNVAAGSRAIRERRTDVVQLASGYEERNARWSLSRRSFDVGLGIRTADDLDAVGAIFEAARGRLHSFRFRDWSDWRSGAVPSAPITPTDQPLGTGDGSQTAFQVVKVYGAADPVTRAIVCPHAASVRVAVDGSEVLTGWALSLEGGRVVFDTPPAPGAVLTCGFTYDVPVRFADDVLALELAFFRDTGEGLESLPDVSLVEVRLA